MSIEIIQKYLKEDGTLNLQDENFIQEIKEYEDNKAEEFENTIAKGLKTKNQELQEENRKIKEKAGEVDTLKQRLEQLENKKAEDNGDYKTIAESLRNQIKELEEQKNTELENVSNINKALQDKTVDSFARDTLKANGVDPDLLDFILPEFKSKADIEVKEDGDFNIMARLGEDAVDFNDYVKETLKHDKYKRALLAPQDEGGNAPGNGSKSFEQSLKDEENPWKTGNLTKQIEIKESNPVLAEKLQNEK